MNGVKLVKLIHGSVAPETTAEINYEDDNDLDKLKHLSEKLNLATRRPSVIQWNQVIENRRSMGLYTADLEQITELEAAVENRKQNVDEEETNTQSHPDINRNPVCPDNVSIFKEHLPVINVSDINNNNDDGKSTKISPTIDETADVLSDDDNDAKLFRSSTDNADVKIITDDRNHSSVTAEITNDCKAEVIRNFCYCDSEKELNQTEEFDGKSINFRCRNISKALDKLKKDLISMRIEDHRMAHNFLELRSDMTMTRAQIMCDEHADMLDDITYEMEEEELLPGLIKACDLPSHFRGSLLNAFSPLKHIGVSRMNLNTRRFSIR